MTTKARRGTVEPFQPRTRAPSKRGSALLTYQLKLTLMETDPPIWRRLRAPGSATLAQLDRVIQAAMGWTNSHLHTFTAGGTVYAVPSPDWDVEMEDERRFRLEQVAKETGEAFVYEYDLGDSWQHQVLVEAVRFEKGPAEAACLAGERACPPEDSGGVHGYYEKLECLRDKRHPEHRETKRWLDDVSGGPFDPEAFDLASVNRALKRLS